MSFAPIVDRKFTDENGFLTERSNLWMGAVTRLQIIVGTGSPEGVIDAAPTRLYMDSAGFVGSILYIKRDADIAGDSTKGWVLV